MKKMSEETKCFIYECIMLVTSMVIFFGVLVIGLLNLDWMVWTSLWLVMGWFGVLCYTGYWMLALMNITTSADSQEEDR